MFPVRYHRHMTNIRKTLGQHVAPARFIAFLVIFAVAFAALVGPLAWSRAMMAGFDIAGVIFIVSLVPVLSEHGAEAMKKHARENDANRAMLLVITSVVMIAILTAVFSELAVKSGGGPPMG